LWTYFTGSYVDGSDDVLWFRDPTGRREVSFVYDPARHRIVEGDVSGFKQDRGSRASVNGDDQYQSQKKRQQERTISMGVVNECSPEICMNPSDPLVVASTSTVCAAPVSIAFFID
jgi:hypothetical protein